MSLCDVSLMKMSYHQLHSIWFDEVSQQDTNKRRPFNRKRVCERHGQIHYSQF